MAANIDGAAEWRAGAQALRNGQPALALSAFQRIVDAGRADAAVWLGVAMATHNLGDAAQHLNALDRVLELEPTNIRALMMKGDHYVRKDDASAASSFYRAVVRIGAAEQALAPDLADEVRRAQAACDALGRRFEAHLRETMAHRGVEKPGAERVAASLDIMMGSKQVYLQQPTMYYFPELPQVQFYGRDANPWLDGLEAVVPAIRAELLDLMQEDHLFLPYVEDVADRATFDPNGLLSNADWSALFLVKNGERVKENAERCPRTLSALQDIPLCRIPGRTPSILFSRLKPGARIPPHNGLLNSRLICHLPLIVPPGCGFRVGNDVRSWTEGKAWCFDDSIEHEAWNLSSLPRVVLIFDVWRPELTGVERDLVSELLQTAHHFTGGAGELSV